MSEREKMSSQLLWKPVGMPAERVLTDSAHIIDWIPLQETLRSCPRRRFNWTTRARRGITTYIYLLYICFSFLCQTPLWSRVPKGKEPSRVWGVALGFFARCDRLLAHPLLGRHCVNIHSHTQTAKTSAFIGAATLNYQLTEWIWLAAPCY